MALSSGTALVALDGSIVTVALPTIAEQLHIADSSAVFFITLYQVVLIMTIMPIAATGDSLGHRIMYQRGLVVHLAGSAMCYFAADSIALLFIGRGLQALGTAGVLGMTAALVRTIYPRAWLGRGLSMNSMIVAVATAAGPVLSGMIIGSGEWQAIFAVSVPAAICALAVSFKLPEPRATAAKLDKRAAVLSSLGVGLLVLSIQGVTYNDLLPISAAALLVALMCLAAFIRFEIRSGGKFLPIGLFRQPVLAFSISGSFLAAVSQMLVIVSLPFILSDEFGATPEQIGLMMAPWPLAMMICGLGSGVLSDYVWPPIIGTVGASVAVVGFLCLSSLPADMNQFDFAWRVALCGAGLGIYFPTNGRLVVNAAPAAQLAVAGSMISTTRMTAQAIGAALAAVIIHAKVEIGGLPMLIGAGLCFVALTFSSLRLRHR